MDRQTYRRTRHAYRLACYQDRLADRRRAIEVQYSDTSSNYWPAMDRQQAVLAGLPSRERAAVVARPWVAFNPTGRLPLGPKAEAFFRREPGSVSVMDLNKRVALRRAIAQIETARAAA